MSLEFHCGNRTFSDTHKFALAWDSRATTLLVSCVVIVVAVLVVLHLGTLLLQALPLQLLLLLAVHLLEALADPGRKRPPLHCVCGGQKGPY